MTWNWPNCIVSDLAHDGDTVRIDVDMGRGTWWRRANVRLAGLNAPELGTPGGIPSRDFLRSLLPVGTPVSLESVGYDKYGDRVDAYIVRTADGLRVNQTVIDSGYAVKYGENHG
jgi:endonuclease YncB( thermonuclease family)